MTTGHVTYEDYLASLGNPDHHIMVGPDWWACLCGAAVIPGDPHVTWSAHQRRFGGEAVQIPVAVDARRN